jgi:hypothetical protein
MRNHGDEAIMRNRVYGLMLLGVLSGSAGAVTTMNGMAFNGLNANGLNANGLNANGLNANGLNANGLNANGLNANGLTPATTSLASLLRNAGQQPLIRSR